MIVLSLESKPIFFYDIKANKFQSDTFLGKRPIYSSEATQYFKKFVRSKTINSKWINMDKI